MNQLYKKIIAIAASGLLVFSVYFGSFLPLRKSQAFINTMRNLNNSPSLDEFKKAISVPLDLPSPIGQEELVRQAASVVMNVINQPNANSSVVDDLLSYVSRYYEPIISNGTGMSFGQNLYILGSMNEIAFVKTNQPKYLEAAKKYYLKSFELGPKRPQPLFGLFDIYRMEGNVEQVKAIAGQILSQWPNEDRTRKALSEFLDRGLTKKK
ncbi:MAG: hypothetical protein AAB738_00860 [Patescibacteria group bacterium]